MTAGRHVGLAGSDPPLADPRRRAAPARRGGLAARRDLQPGDLREGDPRLAGLRRADRAPRPRGAEHPRRLPGHRHPGRPGGVRRVMRSVYDELGGADGFVSLEVDPDLAFDTDRTIAQAREYWGRVDRPNVMIKIPGTSECLPAIEQAIYEGININVTLLFSVEAYVDGRRGLHPRPRAPPRRGLVAGRAVGRVVLRLARRLRGRQAPREARPLPSCRGKAAIANARAAYQRFERDLPRRALRRPGGRWRAGAAAAVGVDRRQEPHLPRHAVRRGAVGPDTVNTMPMPTLMACAERLEVHGATVCEDPTPVLDALAEAGIDMDEVTDKLLRDGIDAFVTPMEKLLAGIEAKREAIFTGRPETIDASLPFELEAPVAEIVQPRRGRAGRAPHLEEGPDAVGPARPARGRQPARLAEGAPRPTREEIDDLEAFAAELAQRGLHRRRAARDGRLVAGARGAAPELRRSPARAPAPAGARLDRPGRDPRRRARRSRSTTRSSSSRRSPAGRSRRCRCTSTSGRWRARRRAVRRDHRPGLVAGDARAERGFRRTFLNDPDVGGRYSALTFFGLVPAALMGVDLQRLLDGAGVAAEACAGYHPPRAEQRPVARRRARRARARTAATS